MPSSFYSVIKLCDLRMKTVNYLFNYEQIVYSHFLLFVICNIMCYYTANTELENIETSPGNMLIRCLTFLPLCMSRNDNK